MLGIAESPDGSSIALGTFGAVYVLNTLSGAQIAEPLDGHGKRGVYALAYSPDGQVLVTGGWDGKVVAWDTTTRELLGDPSPTT